MAPSVKLSLLKDFGGAFSGFIFLGSAEHMDMQKHLYFVSYGKGRMSLVLGTQHEFAWGMGKPVKEMGTCFRINPFMLENMYKYIKKTKAKFLLVNALQNSVLTLLRHFYLCAPGKDSFFMTLK